MSEPENEQPSGLKVGAWRGERVISNGEEAVCIWQPFLEADQESGFCIDFRPSQIDDLIELLQQLKTAQATEIEVGEVPEDADGSQGTAGN